MKKFQGDKLGSLLERINLKGRIEECVLTVVDGKATVRAMDVSNTTFVASTAKVGMEDCTLGLSRLSTLCKFLNDAAEVSIKVKDTQLALRRKGHGSLTVVLLEPEEVSTKVEDANAPKKIMKNASITKDFTADIKEKLEYYLALVNCESVVFECIDKVLSIRSGGHTDSEFQMRAGKVKSPDNVKVEVYTECLKPVMQVADFSNEKPPVINFGADSPLIITQGKNTIWALTPVVED